MASAWVRLAITAPALVVVSGGSWWIGRARGVELGVREERRRWLAALVKG